MEKRTPEHGKIILKKYKKLLDKHIHWSYYIDTNKQTQTQYPNKERKIIMLKVRNLTSSRSGREVANQFVIRDTENKKVTFQSYDSPIIEIDFANNILRVFRDWNYSKTTGKYRNQFMSDEFYGLDTAKELEKAMHEGVWDDHGTTWKIIKAY